MSNLRLLAGAPQLSAVSKNIVKLAQRNPSGEIVRVLIVDDHERIRRGVRLLLSRMAEVEVCGEAVSGSEALDAAQRCLPDVVVMDIDIPGTNGIEVTRQMRRLYPKIQVVIMSLYDIPNVKTEASKAGAVAYVAKSSIWKLVPILQKMQTGELARQDQTAAGENGHPGADLEHALRNCEERFHSAFEQMAVGMGHVDAEGHWLRVNQKLCDIAGYTKTEIQQLAIPDMTHPADLGEQARLDRKVAAGELDHYFLEKRYIRKDGRIAWIHLTVNAVRDAQGRLKYCLHVAQDATAGKETEERLAQARRDLQFSAGHLQLVTDRITASLTRCNRELRYVWVNENYAHWLERSAEKIIGRTILEVVGKEAFERLQPHFDQVLAGNKTSYEGTVNYERIGPRRIFAAYSPTRDSLGVVDGWVDFVEDLTARTKNARNFGS